MKKQSILNILSITMIPFVIISCSNQVPQNPTVKTQTADVKPYPLDTCMVIGAKLSSTPKTYTRIHNGQEVKFCCKNCIKAFEANPEFFIAKLQ